MENSSGIQASLTGRYAQALFDLANDQQALPAVEASLGKVEQALKESTDFAAVATSPVLSRTQSGKAMAAAASALGLDPLTTKFVGVLAQNRRLSDMGGMVRAFRSLAAHHRGETSAEVVSAHPLTDDQMAALKTQLRQRLGRDVTVSPTVDPSILGGLIVKIGSQQIDSSIRTRLNSLAHAMKG